MEEFVYDGGGLGSVFWFSIFMFGIVYGLVRGREKVLGGRGKGVLLYYKFIIWCYYCIGRLVWVRFLNFWFLVLF